MSRRFRTPLVALLASPPALAAIPAEYDVHIDPAGFVADVDNPWFPLAPGTVYQLVETSRGVAVQNTVVVLAETRVILGVRCTVVHDTEFREGRMFEETFDWYAQDTEGNVWYFGEDTRHYDKNGGVDTSGSWEAGVNGALPGVVMKGKATPGEPYRQEYLRGQAEDVGQVIAVGVSVRVPAENYTQCVQTRDWSLLEPGRESKWYCPGVGLVKESAGPRQQAVLVSVTIP